jgi:hypothetical protein
LVGAPQVVRLATMATAVAALTVAAVAAVGIFERQAL